MKNIIEDLNKIPGLTKSHVKNDEDVYFVKFSDLKKVIKKYEKEYTILDDGGPY